MATKEPAKKSPLVAKALRIRKKIAALLELLEPIHKQLIARGAGRYEDQLGNFCTVIDEKLPTTGPITYELPEDKVDQAIEIAGEAFSNIFDSAIVYAPKSGFTDRLEVLLPEDRRAALRTLCTVPGEVSQGKAAHIRWPKLTA